MRLLLIISMMLLGFAGPAPVFASSTVSLGSGTLDIAAGQTAPLPVTVSDIQGLYGFEIHLSFDPAVVEVVDADPGASGVQVKVGDFLAPDFVVLNHADNQTGKIDIGLTQMNPREAKSGSGTLFTISFLGRTTGQSTQVQITNGLFADRDGMPIAVAPAASTLRVVAVGSQQPTLTPSPRSGLPTATTAPPTATPRPSATPSPSGESRPTATPARATATVPVAGAASPTPLPIAAAGSTATQPAPATAPKRGPETISPAPSVQPDRAQAAAQTPAGQSAAAQSSAPPATSGAGLSAATSTRRVMPTSEPTLLVRAATATPVLLARAPAAEPGKPILAGNTAYGADAASARTTRSDPPATAVLTAAGVALGIALLCLVAVGVLLWRRRARVE